MEIVPFPGEEDNEFIFPGSGIMSQKCNKRDLPQSLSPWHLSSSDIRFSSRICWYVSCVFCICMAGLFVLFFSYRQGKEGKEEERREGRKEKWENRPPILHILTIKGQERQEIALFGVHILWVWTTPTRCSITVQLWWVHLSWKKDLKD